MILAPRTLVATFVLTALSLTASAQTPASNTTGWESEAFKLRLFYPSDLVKGDPESAKAAMQAHIEDGFARVLGSMSPGTSKVSDDRSAGDDG